MPEATDAFLARAGVRPGWACLDAGRGDGGRPHGGEAAGLEAAEERTVVNPMRTAEEKIFLAELVDKMRGAILEAAAEIDGLRDAVAAAARDQATVFCQAVMHQARGIRPRGRSA